MKRWLQLLTLMLAGESIYLLPYMRRTFQTAMEDVYGLSPFELGQLNSTFGVVALLCYLPGGWLADRLPARHLLTASLVATSLGALVLLGSPGRTALFVLHAYWGVTAILGFWAALIKATRRWGGRSEQGLGFGLLDGGRGVVAAVLASVATYFFTRPGGVESRLDAVLWVYGLAPLSAAFCVWWLVPAPREEEDAQRGAGRVERLRRCARLPEVWLLAAIVFAAYWLYVGSFALPAYAERVHGRDDRFGAVLGTARDWVRPLAAVGAGLLADRIRGSRCILWAFGMLAITCGSLSLLPKLAVGGLWLWLQVGAMATGVFALRGVYFALLEEGGVPKALTGTAVGFVSVLGFVPDTFAFLLSGYMTGGPDPAAGYARYFGLLTGVALVGATATWVLGRRSRGRRGQTG